jgi:hypothetical protein
MICRISAEVVVCKIAGWFLCVICMLGGILHASAQDAPNPWQEPQDTSAAVFDPDAYAWRLFVALNWPANVDSREPDPGKSFGTDGPVVWETWRNVRNDAPDTVFRLDGKDPGEWIGAAVAVARMESAFDPEPRQQQIFSDIFQRPGGTGAAPAFDDPLIAGSETRMNRSAYEFVRQNQLYNIEGQISEVNSGKKSLLFPASSKEIKAVWTKIDPSDKPRYHWAEIRRDDGSTEIWGLTGLHILTKDIPNWFWTTFEHIDNKTSGEGWKLASVDRLACPQAPHDCEKAPSGIGLEGTKWENYRLRGTQIDFIDSVGTPMVLANSRIETGNQTRSSCMTCHALATRDGNGAGLGFAFITGPPQPGWFQSGAPIMQTDFLWSLLRAANKQP